MHSVISAALLMVVSITMVAMVVSFGAPILERDKADMNFEEGKNSVNYLSGSVIDLSDDPIYSSKYADIEFGSGFIEFEGNTLSYTQEPIYYNRTFDGLEFNDLRVYPGRNHIKLTKTSVHEIQVSLS